MEQEYIAQGGQRFPHIFGTDEQCRDYFVRVIYGTRVSLCVGLFASIIVMIIGVIYGSISGYLGGKVDLIMMRIVDIIYSLPGTRRPVCSRSPARYAHGNTAGGGVR